MGFIIFTGAYLILIAFTLYHAKIHVSLCHSYFFIKHLIISSIYSAIILLAFDNDNLTHYALKSPLFFQKSTPLP